jgi:hypothetical protein
MQNGYFTLLDAEKGRIPISEDAELEPFGGRQTIGTTGCQTLGWSFACESVLILPQKDAPKEVGVAYFR